MHQKDKFTGTCVVEVYSGRPIFLPEWWNSLNFQQKRLLSIFILSEICLTAMFIISIQRDSYFLHNLKLFGLYKSGYGSRKVVYNLSYDVTVGYWRYSGDEEPAYKNLERHPSRVQDSLLEHLHVAIELWHYCTHLAHRSLTCYNSAFILLTLGISILFIIPFIGIFNRIIMIKLSICSGIILVFSLLLITAATKEYRNCIISRVDSGKEHYHGKVVDVPYKGRYFYQLILLTIIHLLEILSLGVYIFCL
uniref:Uncharacterized protein n=1 Tax=Trichobilharzia regenti TaxID=157069 RepID=A0AA85K4D9_TRIRE|nr:unnamed protein product [Trichobilharzia regenti]